MPGDFLLAPLAKPPAVACGKGWHGMGWVGVYIGWWGKGGSVLCVRLGGARLRARMERTRLKGVVR